MTTSAVTELPPWKRRLMIGCLIVLGVFYPGSWLFFKIYGVDYVVAAQERRRQAPEPYLLDTPLYFAGPEAAAVAQYQVRGWSYPEPWGGAWTNGPVAELAMRLTPVPSGPLTLRLRIERAMLHAQQPIQEVEVVVNDQTIGRYAIQTGDLPSDQAWTIPETVLRPDGALRLVLRMGHPASLRALGQHEDNRRLGIGVGQIRISPTAVDLPSNRSHPPPRPSQNPKT